MSVPATITPRPPIDDSPTDDPEPGDDGAGGVWLSWPRLAVLVAAVAFLGGSTVFFLEHRDPAPSDVDVGFYHDMTTHHDQAVVLAMLELDRGENITARSFATEVLIFQNRELGIMGLRLADWGAGAGSRPELAMEWMDMPVEPARMPGMASEEEIDELRAAEGADADALFLELLAEHHRGGVHMALHAAEHAEDGETRRLAATMARYQAIEVNEMAQTAERLGFDISIERMEVPPPPR